MRELVDHWQQRYDWRSHEAALNRFAQFKAVVDGAGIQFIYERGKGPNPTPLLLLHGFPTRSTATRSSIGSPTRQLWRRPKHLV
jgi:hypothetical protein